MCVCDLRLVMVVLLETGFLCDGVQSETEEEPTNLPAVYDAWNEVSAYV